MDWTIYRKRLRLGLYLVIALFLPACGGGGGTSQASPATPGTTTPTASRCSPYARDGYLTADYYVDGASGSDTNSGSFTTPWKTLAKALTVTTAAVIHVRTGTYGVLAETAPVSRTGYLTIRAAPGHIATLTGVNISYPVLSSSKLRIIGFSIKPDYLPNNSAVIKLDKVSNMELHDNLISTDKYTVASAIPGTPNYFDGISITASDNILIKSNSITSVFRGVQIYGSTNTRIQCNYISPKAGSAIQYLSYNNSTLIDDNHIRGGTWVLYPLDPDAPDRTMAHASMISIRSGGIIIRNNIMHGMGSTSGIRFYFPDATGGLSAYSNINIEGNLIYDVDNPHVLQMDNSAEQVTVRNNLIISRYRSGACSDGVTGDARYRYELAFYATIASGYTGSGLNIYNNIFIGLVSLPLTANEHNNIYWSYTNDGTTFPATSPSGTSKIITSSYRGCNNHSRYFESGFFKTTPDFSVNHGLIVDYSLSPTSGAINFGDSSLQLQTILGTLDASNIFIDATGTRTVIQHSAGPFEF